MFRKLTPREIEAAEFTANRCGRCESPIQSTSPSARYCVACWDEVQRVSPWLRGPDFRADAVPFSSPLAHQR